MTASDRINRIGKETDIHSLSRVDANLDFPHKAIILYKKNISGLSGFCRLVMYELLEYINLESGTITINSLDKLSRDDFQVDPLRGRQKEVINGDTIRNAFRTIKKAKPDHFKFTTVNQRIIIEMPFLRELYQSIYGETQEVAAILAADVAAVTTHTQSSESPALHPILAEDVAGELAAASMSQPINAPTHACVKTNPTKPNNNNSELDDLLDSKKPIADDFYPSEFLIEKALGMGLPKVTDPDEITKFIAFNKATGSQWKQYDYVYLTWLQRDAEREKAKQAAEQQLKPTYSSNSNNTGKPHHGPYSTGSKSTASQRVIAAYSKEGLEYCAQTNRFKERAGATTHINPIQYIDIDSLGPIE